MQAEENERAGRGSRTFWLWKTIVLAGEGKRSGSVWASALAEEDKRAGCGRQVRLLRKPSALAVEGVGVSEGRKTCW